LYRQLILAISLLIACLLAGNLVVSVLNARGYVFEQMAVHAQDTATSLGLTLSHAAESRDRAEIESFIDVVFDRGYYRHIFYRSIRDDLLVQRVMPIEIEGVPAWCIRLLDLPEPSGKAEVVSGWMRLGELQVVSHPGYAYRDLWRVFCEQLWLFLATAVLCYGAAGLGLHYLLRPLKKVEQQAEAICRREFPLQPQLPRTPELRRMVMAMNRMVEKIRTMFQEQVELTATFHRQARLDAVTGLSNRLDFDARLEAFMVSESGGSAVLLLLLQVGNLQQFNQRSGREAGDDVLRHLAALLQAQIAARPGALASRRGGADFCVLVPVAEPAEEAAWVAGLFQRLLALHQLSDTVPALQLHMGVAAAGALTRPEVLLAKADLALRQAQHQYRDDSGCCWLDVVADGPGVARPAGAWRELLQGALQRRQLVLFWQPVFAADGESLLHREVFCRLQDGEQLLSAGVFWPMVERFGLAPAMDRLIIELLCESGAEAVWGEVAVSVNLSPTSILDEGFTTWLSAFLQIHPAFAARILFELPEQALVANEQAVRQFAVRMQALGAGIGLDHFGASASAFHYLQSLPIALLKVSRSFVTGLDRSSDNQFFVRALLQIAHSCEIQLLAEGVETAAEWQALLSIGVDGGQGFELGRPTRIDIDADA
jgi:diguanylate cyclase (GGDEF)-like protein